MKKLLILTAAIIFVTSCNKDNDNDNDNTNGNQPSESCRIQTFVEEGDTILFSYDDSGLMKKIAICGEGLDTSDYYVLFFYDSQNRMIKLESYDEGELDSYETYTYESNKIICDELENDGLVYFRQVNNLNSDGYVTNVDYFHRENGNLVESDNHDIYEWANGNILQNKIWSNSFKGAKKHAFKFLNALLSGLPDAYTMSANKNDSVKYVHKYSYDDKESFYGLLDVPCLPESKNMNNTVTDSTFHLSGSYDTIVSVYSYEYNEKGYPTSCEIVITGTINGQTFSTSDSWQAVYDCN